MNFVGMIGIGGVFIIVPAVYLIVVRVMLIVAMHIQTLQLGLERGTQRSEYRSGFELIGVGSARFHNRYRLVDCGYYVI